MPAIDEINGVSAANIDEVCGKTKSQIDDLCDGLSLGDPIATQWYCTTNSGKVFISNGAPTSGWTDLVDLGSYNVQQVTVGQDDSGAQIIMVHTKNNSEEISYIVEAPKADMDAEGDWTTKNLSLSFYAGQSAMNCKADDEGRGLTYGNGVWLAACLTGAQGNNAAGDMRYEGLIKSTDGGDNWTAVPLGNTVSTSMNSVAYKGGTTGVWLVAVGKRMVKSTNNGGDWTWVNSSDGTEANANNISSGNRIIYDMAYDGNGRWVAVMDGDEIYTSDDDGDNWTARTSALAGNNRLRTVVYAKGSIQKWIIGGESGRMAYSSNGVNWTVIWDGDDSTWGGGIIYQIATDHTTVCVVGNNGMIATSTDGINYTVQSPAVDTTGDGSPDYTVALRSVCSNVQGAGFY